MATALNFTLRLKQDPASQQALKALEAGFADKVQPAIDNALRVSKIVHFARVLVIRQTKDGPGEYIQVLTEFDGDKRIYTDFFREKLPEVFKAIFALADGMPPWDELKDPDTFYKYSRAANVRALGGRKDDEHEGWLFSAYGDRQVTEILGKLGA